MFSLEESGCLQLGAGVEAAWLDLGLGPQGELEGVGGAIIHLLIYCYMPVL